MGNHAQALRVPRRKGLDGIVDLEGALAVSYQQLEWSIAIFKQGVKDIRRARAEAEHRSSMNRLGVRRGRRQTASDLRDLWRRAGQGVLDKAFGV
jgi:hypothetical protein